MARSPPDAKAASCACSKLIGKVWQLLLARIVAWWCVLCFVYALPSFARRLDWMMVLSGWEAVQSHEDACGDANQERASQRFSMCWSLSSQLLEHSDGLRSSLRTAQSVNCVNKHSFPSPNGSHGHDRHAHRASLFARALNALNRT